ncbi:hypothetical protein DFJ74DRAFT_679600 [Hyaloraphidium curvatum]|nr:hypothetical protein DFJ74DRAFT_679600 [Hyaloraphidium curvatum]
MLVWTVPPPPGADQAAACRICRDDEPSPADPLLTPCGCRGSLSSVHRSCLSAWRRSSPAARLRCEVCLQPWAGRDPRLRLAASPTARTALAAAAVVLAVLLAGYPVALLLSLLSSLLSPAPLAGLAAKTHAAAAPAGAALFVLAGTLLLIRDFVGLAPFAIPPPPYPVGGGRKQRSEPLWDRARGWALFARRMGFAAALLPLVGACRAVWFVWHAVERWCERMVAGLDDEL